MPREFRRKVEPGNGDPSRLELHAVPGQWACNVSLYISVGNGCDVNVYLPSTEARELASLLLQAADVADGGADAE
jgi:hypothetical protein